MNSLALSNLPVSSADIVVGLVGSKVQELPESPEWRPKNPNFRTGGSSSVAGWIFFRCGLVFYIDLRHHGYNHGEKSVSFPLVGEGDYANRAESVNPPPLNLNPPKNTLHQIVRKGSNYPPPSPHVFF